MTRYIVSVGSNINAEQNVDLAFKQIQLIDSHAHIASLLRTKAQGDTTQPDYINTAFLFQTDLDKHALKLKLLDIEKQLGRVRQSNKNAARPIDLDITQIDNNIVDEDYYRYDFVKKSVDELNSNNSFNNLLETIQKFEQSIEKQLAPLDLNYKQVLLLLNIKNKNMNLGDNDYASIQYLLVKKWIADSIKNQPENKTNQTSDTLSITPEGEKVLTCALNKLETFEKRLFQNQKMQHSLLTQLNKLYGF
ncbi:2-amino-4-hydroxy-6-hydroxymethyldihydropteridine diphosphokinase [Marinicellulosiphila megalodicopiae]|uniref:2-amino-4-hydroxy-6- hydroxymethyldihydropteridine diphosphokinase n=1 Tax=Marinicellulosiphila megalodicopiae TaxID=2724896 RepID=UPI003BAF6431